jgi:hypothetical protein
VPPATRPTAWQVTQLEAISGQTVLVNCGGAVHAAAAVAPGVAGLVGVFEAPVANVLDPPPQALRSAAATQAKNRSAVERKLEATSDRIVFPLRVR